MRDAFGVDRVSKGMKLPNGTRIRLRTKTVNSRSMPGKKFKVIQARDKGKHVGFMELDHAGRVSMVETAEPYRRKGIATHLWQTAKKKGLDPKHTAFRSESGDAWARAVGGKIPTGEEDHKVLTDAILRDSAGRL